MTLLPVATNDPHVAAHNEERDAINALQEEIPLLVPKPENPNVGELMRWDGVAWVPSITRLFEGQGSPEGVVAAPIGSRYVDTAASVGAIEWIKRAGLPTSNTGWQLSVYANSGLRNISALIDRRTNGVVNLAYLQRSVDQVDLYLDLTMPTSGSTGTWTLFTLPEGFRPPMTRYGALQDNKEAASNGTYVTSLGVVALNSIVLGKRDRYQGNWITRDPWPDVLPGVEA